jgi:hypothetical protein
MVESEQNEANFAQRLLCLQTIQIHVAFNEILLNVLPNDMDIL